MTGAEHYHEAEQAISASIGHKQRAGRLAAGSAAAQDALDDAFWELRRAEVHAQLACAANGPAAAGARPAPAPR
ncbi:MAG: hypothetical protein ACRDPY_26750, partial [Streptosporangiaceae bacterium]